MKHRCPNCGKDIFSSYEKLLSGRFFRRPCRNCGALVHVDATWLGVIGGTTSVLLSLLLGIAILTASMTLFLLGIAICGVAVGLIVLLAPLASDKVPGSS